MCAAENAVKGVVKTLRSAAGAGAPRTSGAVRAAAAACRAVRAAAGAALLLVLTAAPEARAQAAAPSSAAPPAAAAGQVETARGVGFVQAPGQAVRALGQGAAVNEGDTLSTGKDSYAIVKLSDGTRMTVRPESQLTIQTYRYDTAAPAAGGSMVMNLVRGGLRTVTGLIAKGSPEAAKIRTSTATIGIRGTDFDARICAKDCAQDSNAARQAGASARPAAIAASARAVKIVGELTAVAANGERRRVPEGGALYNGDTVETAAASSAILVFRDDSRMSLGPQSRLKIAQFVYDPKTPSEGRFFVDFLRGTARMVTGLVAKADNRNVKISTATATIGVRGTEFGLVCVGSCASGANEPGGASDFLLFTIDGQTIANLIASGVQIPLPAGSGVQLGADGRPISINGIPLDRFPPIQIAVNLDLLFGSAPVGETEGQTVVFVRSGDVDLESGGRTLNLGAGETGIIGADGLPQRPDFVPLFIDFDRIPLPTVRATLLGLLQAQGLNPSRVCR